MASAPDREPAAVSAGQRGVAVAGDVTGSVIVTGDNVDVKLLLGSEHGALIERLSRSERPRKELRRAPLQNIPGRPPDSIDRDREADAIAGSGVSPANTLNIHGETAVGKTYALLRVLDDGQAPFAAKAVYVYAAGELDDVLQAVFDAFYEQVPLAKSSIAQLRRDLAQVSGPVLLDQLELDRDAAQQLQLILARCSIVVVSRERVIWGAGTSLPIHGLEPQFATSLIESEIARSLQPAEQEPARRICAALAGHPLRIREAVAPVREDGRSLAEIADLVTHASPREALAQACLAGADPEQRRLLATLALFGESAVGREHLRALIDAPEADAIIDAALASRDLRAHSPRYGLGLAAGDAARSLDLAAAGDRALSHFVAWAQATHTEPDVQLIEGAALLALLRWAVANGRLPEAIVLGRAIDAAFAAGRRFEAWRELLELVRTAAIESGDRAAEAWALHQLGTRALALGELAGGIELLRRALEMRRELRDGAGASVTERNLALARRLTRARRGIWRNPFLLLLVAALIVAGVVNALAGHHSPSPQNGGGPHNHNVVAISTPGPQHTIVHSSVALQIKATDSADAKLTYVAGGLPPGLGIDRSTGLITGHPNRTGSYDVTVGADDQTGANDKAQFKWTVTPGSANTVTIRNPGPQTGTVKRPVSLQIEAEDSAGAKLTYAAAGLPAGLSIGGSTGQITGTPTQSSSSSVTVTARDSSGASGSTTFGWTITPSKTTPNPITITSPGDQSDPVHSRVSLQIQASGPPQATLTYAATGLPKGLSLDSASGLISGVPDSAGPYSVTVAVADTANHENMTSFTWTITRPSGQTGTNGQGTGTTGQGTGTTGQGTGTTGQGSGTAAQGTGTAVP